MIILTCLRFLQTLLCCSLPSALHWSLHQAVARQPSHTSSVLPASPGEKQPSRLQTLGKRKISCSASSRGRDRMTEQVLAAFIRNLFHSSLVFPACPLKKLSSPPA